MGAGGRLGAVVARRLLAAPEGQPTQLRDAAGPAADIALSHHMVI
jgi:hypothetical protein